MNALLKLSDLLKNMMVLGGIQAGIPVTEGARPDRLDQFDMDALRIPNNSRTFALKVRGQSMVNVGIYDGDIVIIEFNKEPRSGDIVAALIDGDSTLKRYVTKQGKAFLKAENARFPVLVPAQELVIQGVMVGLLRLV